MLQFAMLGGDGQCTCMQTNFMQPLVISTVAAVEHAH